MVGVCVAAGVQLVAAPGASANDFGTPCVGDDGVVRGYACSLVDLSNPIYKWEGTAVQIPNLKSDFYNRLWNMAGRTDLSPRRNDSASNPHVRATDYDYHRDDPVAWVRCAPSYWARGGSHPTRWCHGKKIRFNGYYENHVYNTQTDRRRIACHELGHSVGLQHGSSTASCMHAGFFQSVIYIGGHHPDHINDHY